MKKASSQEQKEEDLFSECVSCEKPCVLSVAFCPQCNGMICKECINAHKTMKQLRDKHQATMLNEFKQENLDDFIKKQMLCKEKLHEKNDLQYYYCKEETCRHCICQSCFMLAHRNHDMETVEGAAEQVKQTIKEGMNKLDLSNRRYFL
jgi:hypothetical protein